MPSLSFVFKKIKTTLKKSGTRMEKVADQAFKIKKEKVRNDMMQLTSFNKEFNSKRKKESHFKRVFVK